MTQPVPRVSVLMPVYNCAPYLSAAIDSIIEQTFQDFEFVIIDDGSNDGSEQILSDYAAKSPRIKILRNTLNLGIVQTLNRGILECRGEFIARMDADDISLPERLEKQILELEKHPDIVVLGGAVRYIDVTGKELGVVREGTPDSSLLFQNPLLHPTVIMRRHILCEHDLAYEEPYRYAEDYFLWLRMSRYGRLASLDDVVLHYRVSFGASRFRHTKTMIARTLRVKWSGVVKLGIRPQFPDFVRFAAECILMLVPVRVTRWLYLKQTFRDMVEPKL